MLGFGRKEQGATIPLEGPKGIGNVKPEEVKLPIPCKKDNGRTVHLTDESAEKCCGVGKGHDDPDPKIEADRKKAREQQHRKFVIGNLEAGVRNAKEAQSLIEISSFNGRDAKRIAECLAWLAGIQQVFERDLTEVRNGKKIELQEPKK